MLRSRDLQLKIAEHDALLGRLTALEAKLDQLLTLEAKSDEIMTMLKYRPFEIMRQEVERMRRRS